MATQPGKFQCASCGAGMEWDPASARLACPACKSGVEVHPLGSVDEIPFENFAGQQRKLSESALEVKCSGCGAVTQFEPGQVAGKCPFCAAAIVMQPKAADPLIAPHGVLPFAVTSDRAAGAVKAWLGGLWFAPNDLKRVAQQEGLQGVYVPYWTYDAETYSQYTGLRGTWVTDQRGQRRVEWENCSGSVACGFDDVLAPATKAVQPGRLDALEPWSLEGVRPYESAYLAGFKAQRYQVELRDGFSYAGSKMAARIRRLAEEQIGGDERRVEEVRTQYANVTFKHILLPIWIGAYRYRGQVYQVVANAQSGNVSGERPVSWVKVAFAVMLALLALWIWMQSQS